MQTVFMFHFPYIDYCVSMNFRSDLDWHKVRGNSYICSCYICAMAFSFKFRLKKHMKNGLMLESPYIDFCYICAMAFLFKYRLTNQMQTDMMLESQYIDYCYICVKEFSFRPRPKRHMKLYMKLGILPIFTPVIYVQRQFCLLLDWKGIWNQCFRVSLYQQLLYMCSDIFIQI